MRNLWLALPHHRGLLQFIGRELGAVKDDPFVRETLCVAFADAPDSSIPNSVIKVAWRSPSSSIGKTIKSFTRRQAGLEAHKHVSTDLAASADVVLEDTICSIEDSLVPS